MTAEALQQRIGYCFQRAELLRRALTHRSYSADHNERLEFLGDSVVNCVVTQALFQKFPELSEGELSRLRASLVSEPALAALAAGLDLGGLLRLGEGELKSGGVRRPSMLADALEAVFGAVCVDGGYDAASASVRRVFQEALDALHSGAITKDPKTLLQELLQGRRLPLPAYIVTAIHGEAHDQRFEVDCIIEALNIRCQGTGTSRRRAEQDAARCAYERATRA